MYLAATYNSRRKRGREDTSLQLVEDFKKHEDNMRYRGSLCRKTERSKKTELSLLEKLPKEILQDIFSVSMNCTLPFASRQLASCLTSVPVFLKFSMHVLHVDMGGANPGPEAQCRLFSCRFFTFEFFKQYINWAYDLHLRNRQSDDVDIGPRPDLNELRFLPIHLQPYMQLSQDILVPEKLFHEIWKDGKMHFLRLVFRLSGQTLPTRYLRKRPLQRDSALQGLKLAINHNENDPFFALHPWLKDDSAAWQDLLEHSLAVENVSQSILTNILDFSCLGGCCVEMKAYNWEIALKAADNGTKEAPKLLCAIKNHEAKRHAGDGRPLFRVV